MSTYQEELKAERRAKRQKIAANIARAIRNATARPFPVIAYSYSSDTRIRHIVEREAEYNGHSTFVTKCGRLLVDGWLSDNDNQFAGRSLCSRCGSLQDFISARDSWDKALRQSRERYEAGEREREAKSQKETERQELLLQALINRFDIRSAKIESGSRRALIKWNGSTFSIALVIEEER